MTSAQRRAREKESLRRAILDAARELFATEDYKAISMRRIADRIEYSPTAIYLHFKDKEEILFHLIEEGFALLSEQLNALDTPDPVERLRQGGQIYFHFALTQPHYYRLMFQLEDKNLIHDYMTRCQTSPAAFGFILKAVTEAQDRGQFRTDQHPAVLSHAVWAHIHGAASLALTGHLHKLPDEAHPALFATVIETTLRGLQPDM